MQEVSIISQNIHQAVKILQDGGLVGIPTETVYGLGADAKNAKAVAHIFKVKGRPNNHPLIVHIANANAMLEWAKDIPDVAWKLAKAFWPGPLTLILPRKDGVLESVTGGLDTIALRVPSHPLTLKMLQLFGGGIAAPSANLYGKVSPTSAQDVYEELGENLKCILDGGRCEVGIESTIVDLCSDVPRVLRHGAITKEEIDNLIQNIKQEQKGRPKSYPGDKPSHYAPEAKVILCTEENLEALIKEWQNRSSHIGVLIPSVPKNADKNLTWIAFGEEPKIQAQRLYTSLRKADHLGVKVLLALMPTDEGLGTAIRDRLRRAAGLGDIKVL